MKNTRPLPNFSSILPKDGNYSSLIKIADQYGYICETYNDCGIMKVGLWEKCNFN